MLGLVDFSDHVWKVVAIQRELGNVVLQLVDISVYLVVLLLYNRNGKTVSVQFIIWRQI